MTLAAGKTLTANNSLTLVGTDGSTLAIGTGGTLGTAAYTAATAYDVAGAAAAVTPTSLGLVIGTNVQAYDADLTTWAGITPGANVGTALAVAVGTAGAVQLNNGSGAGLTSVNAATLGGATFAAPGAIGGGTAAAGSFTTLSASGALTTSAATALDLPGRGTVGGVIAHVGTNGADAYIAVANSAGAGSGVNTGSAAYALSFRNDTGFSFGDGTQFASLTSAGLNSTNIGATTPGTGAFTTLSATGVVTFSNYGAGAATFSAAGVISSVSDETWKIKDGVPFDPDAMLKKLQPGYWYYNAEKAPLYGTDRQLGFYAQNVNTAIGPEAAPQPEEGKPWGYYDRSVLAVTVMSLQKALSTIDSLIERIAILEAK